MKDVIGREWQLGTVQVDYNLPARFDLTTSAPTTQPHRPVMIHRAPFGSMERFVGCLIEHFAGAFPVRRAPSHHSYPHPLPPIQAKIKVGAEEKIPYRLIVARVTPRTRGLECRHPEGSRHGCAQ